MWLVRLTYRSFFFLPHDAFFWLMQLLAWNIRYVAGMGSYHPTWHHDPEEDEGSATVIWCLFARHAGQAQEGNQQHCHRFNTCVVLFFPPVRRVCACVCVCLQTGQSGENLLSLSDAVSQAARTAGVKPITSPEQLQEDLESQDLKEAYSDQVGGPGW